MNTENPFDKELRALSAAIRQVRKLMISGAEDVAKMGTLLTKLCDSVIKVKLAEHKLTASTEPGDGLDSTLREMGLGEE